MMVCCHCGLTPQCCCYTVLLVLGVIVATKVFSQVVKLSGIASTIVVDPVVDPSEISSVGYHLDLTETQARREPSGISKGTRGTQGTRDTARDGCCEFWKFHPGPLG